MNVWRVVLKGWNKTWTGKKGDECLHLKFRNIGNHIQLKRTNFAD